MFIYFIYCGSFNNSVSISEGLQYVVSMVTRLLTGQSGVQISAGQEVYLFPKMSRLTLGPAKPPIKWVTGFLPWGKWLGCDIYPPPSSIEVKNEWFTRVVCLHGMNGPTLHLLVVHTLQCQMGGHLVESELERR